MQFVDAAGAISTLSGPVVTASGPVLTIDQPAPGAVTNDPTVAGTCSVGDGTVTATVNPGANVFTSPCSGGGTWSVSIASLADAVYTVSATQAASPLTAGPVSFTYDTTPPATTDNTAAVAGWHQGAVTVTLSPSDNLSGVAATHYTTDGSTPTTGSASGTNVNLSADGVYTIKYFSVDNAGNAEAVKTASTPVMIDQTAPVVSFTPANGTFVGPDRWAVQCATVGVCGTVSDATSGVATIGPATVRRSSDGFYWNGTAFKVTVANAPLTRSGNSWSVALASSKLNDGVSYTVAVSSTDVAGNSVTSSATFTYDKTKPAPTSIATANNDGTIAVGDTFAVTFSEPIDPASVPSTTTLTMTRTGSQKTKYEITGVTSGALATNATGYVTSASGTRTITYNASVAVSGSTVTVTVTSGCTSGCAFVATGPSAGSINYKAPATIADLAGNASAATGINSATVVMF
jgi:hypothetical protein